MIYIVLISNNSCKNTKHTMLHINATITVFIFTFLIMEDDIPDITSKVEIVNFNNVKFCINENPSNDIICKTDNIIARIPKM